MKPLLSACAIVAATFAWLSVLLAVRPFDRINAGLDQSFAALPAWTQVENLYQDATVQEVTRGDHPLRGFRTLATAWNDHRGAARILLMGNSQTQVVSLAPGETRPSQPEKTYTDLIADRFRDFGNKAMFYRLSAGALSYEEMLWYATYFSARPEIKPSIVLVQLNYQNFANGNIRAGMREMLNDVSFRRGIQNLADQHANYSAGFQQALHAFDEARAQGSQRNAMERNAAAESQNLGYALETHVRQALDRNPGFQQRGNAKEAAVLMLLRCRSYFLGLQQATPRSLKGPRIEASRAALRELIDRLQQAKIQVILFEAPTNPRVPLYRTADDDRAYHAFAGELAASRSIPILDFEHSIPAEDWGMALNAPDPLHLGRAGHHLLSELIASRLEQGWSTSPQHGI